MRILPFLFGNVAATPHAAVIARATPKGNNPYSMPQFPGVGGMSGLATTAPWNIPPLSAYSFPAMDLSMHSAYDIPFYHRLPVMYARDDVRMSKDGPTGRHLILGMNVNGLAIENAEQTYLPPTNKPEGPYGDMQIIRVALAAGDSVKVLNRATFKRVLLQIQNRSLANDINYNFGAPASALTFGIPSGGSSSFVGGPTPQNELWITSTAGANVVIGYIDTQPNVDD